METKQQLVNKLDKALVEYEHKYGESKKFISLCDMHALEWKKHFRVYVYLKKTIGELWENGVQRCMICEVEE